MYTKISDERKRELMAYAPYVRIEPKAVRYTRADYAVAIHKDIPIRITKQELIAWCDGWNGCFGGEVLWRGSDGGADLYEVRVYSD